jgi:hypothetical protein
MQRATHQLFHKPIYAQAREILGEVRIVKFLILDYEMNPKKNIENSKIFKPFLLNLQF